jgi:unsaturated rhamnogalacturonyl hydrolase
MMKAGPGALLRRIARRTRRYDFTVWFWGDSIAFDGLLEAAELAGDRASERFCGRFIDRWARQPRAWTDYLTPGAAVLRRHAATGDGAVLDAAVRLGHWLVRDVPRGAGGVHYYRPDLPQFRTTVLVDSLYHVPTFLAALARATGDASFATEAVDAWRSHVALLRHPQGPLLCHNHDVGSGRWRGYGWGRGNGWALLGLVDLLDTLPARHADRRSLIAELKSLAKAILPLQDASGFWRTLLHDREAYLEASTAAFFGAAFTKAHRLGLLGTEYAQAADRAWAATTSRIDAEGGLFGVSGVTWAAAAPAEDLALYKLMPTEVNVWGQGSALRFVAERARSGLRS